MGSSSTAHPRHGGNLTWAATVAGCSSHEILDFSASISPLGPPASALAAIHSHLADLQSYPDPDYGQLRSVLSQHYALPPDWILPGNGSAELLTWACRELSQLNTTCLLAPGFGDYHRALKAFDGHITPLPLPLASWEDLDRAPVRSLPLPKGGVDCSCSGLLLNTPHNPTGSLFSLDSLLPCLDAFALVVVDEAFMDFLSPEQQPSLLGMVQEYPNLVVLRSLTKFYSLPGLRMGVALAHPDRLKRWQQWRDPWSVNALAVAAAIATVQDISFQQQTWQWLATARPRLLDGLAQLPGLHPLPGAANFLLVRSDVSTVDLQRVLLQRHRILIRDCLSFPELGDRYFRVAVRSQSENDQLLHGLAAVLGELTLNTNP